jgi:hypothetical protein
MDSLGNGFASHQCLAAVMHCWLTVLGQGLLEQLPLLLHSGVYD